MKKAIGIIKYPAVFAAAALLCLLLLAASAMIPSELISGGIGTSAEIMCRNRVFYDISRGIPASKTDRYADSILLNIAYHYDSADPLGSVMLSEYYYTPVQNENFNLRDAVEGALPANKEYLRYWHGSAGIVRAALCVTDIGGMYAAGAVIIAGLFGMLLFLLAKHRLYAGAVGTVCALTAAGIWYVPFSLEYIWVFVTAPAVSLIAVKLVLDGKPQRLGVLFMLSGIVTNYLDFLTAETLTLTLPLLLSIYTARSTSPADPKREALSAVKLCCAWAAGYGGMWLLKWVLAAAVLGEDVTPYIFGHISERTIGDVVTGEASIVSAFANNFGCLFPFGYTDAGVIAGIVIMLGAAYVCFVYRRDGIRLSDLMIYAAAGAIPYLRYTALISHSSLHYFFTYRAQAAGVLAVCLMVSEITGIGRAKHEARKRT